jgi:hypothetical protein
MTDNKENINNSTTDIVDNIVLGNVSAAKDNIIGILNAKAQDNVNDYKKEFASDLFKDKEE